MRGYIIDFSVQQNRGVISGLDGSRYTFIGGEWKEKTIPERGMLVDFEANNSVASAVYRIVNESESSKSKITAGVLALVLGVTGAHKLYLGYTGTGMIYLATLAGFFIVPIINASSDVMLDGLFAVLFLAVTILAVISLIEGILYLTKSDEEFEQTYIAGRKNWL